MMSTISKWKLKSYASVGLDNEMSELHAVILDQVADFIYDMWVRSTYQSASQTVT